MLSVSVRGIKPAPNPTSKSPREQTPLIESKIFLWLRYPTFEVHKSLKIILFHINFLNNYTLPLQNITMDL